MKELRPRGGQLASSLHSIRAGQRSSSWAATRRTNGRPGTSARDPEVTDSTTNISLNSAEKEPTHEPQNQQSRDLNRPALRQPEATSSGIEAGDGGDPHWPSPSRTPHRAGPHPSPGLRKARHDTGERLTHRTGRGHPTLNHPPIHRGTRRQPRTPRRVSPTETYRSRHDLERDPIRATRDNILGTGLGDMFGTAQGCSGALEAISQRLPRRIDPGRTRPQARYLRPAGKTLQPAGKEAVPGSSPGEGSDIPAQAVFVAQSGTTEHRAFTRRGTTRVLVARPPRGTGVNPGERKAPSRSEEGQRILGTGFGDTSGVKAEA